MTIAIDIQNIRDTSLLKEVAERFASKAQGSEQIEVYVSHGSDVEISIYKQEVENMTTADATAVGVRVINDHREGSAWAESLDEDILKQTLANARENASISEPDEYAAMVKPSDIDDVVAVQRDGWNDSILTMSIQDKIAMALEVDLRASKKTNALLMSPNPVMKMVGVTALLRTRMGLL